VSGRRILVVEDEMIVQLHLGRIVEEQGHVLVGCAADMDEALRIGRAEQPELVLMDIHLASGSDGVETARALVKELECAIVFISAYADDVTVARTEEVGAAGYLVKPFTSTQVRAAISTAFASHARLTIERRQARSLSSVLEHVGGALFLIDGDDRVSFANQSAADLVGRPVYKVYGRDVFTLIDTESVAGDLALALAQARRGDSALCDGVAVRDPEGRDRIVDISIEPIRSMGTGDDSLLLSLTDRSATQHVQPQSVVLTRRPFGEGTRLMVYSHDTFGLGHLRRCLALIRELCGRYPGLSVLLVTGSPMVHRFAMPPGADYVKIPALQKVGVEQYAARSLQIPGDHVRELRANLVLHTARDYRPNMLLVDHSPVGGKGELRPTLDWLSERGGCTRILGLRDVVDEPEALRKLWHEEGIYDVIERHYDHVVVYGERAHFDPVEEYDLPPAVAARTAYVDYVCSHEDSDPGGPRPAALSGGRRLVFVTIGGGDGGADTVVVPFLEMMREFADHLDFRAEIVMGPFVETELRQRCEALAAGLPVVLHEFLPSTKDLLNQAEVVISTAGYNTVTDVLSFARRSILIPRVLYRQEQRIRAQLLDKRGWCTYLPPEDISAERLLEAIIKVRQDEPLVRARRDGMPLDGAARFASFCGKLQVEVPVVPTDGAEVI